MAMTGDNTYVDPDELDPAEVVADVEGSLEGHSGARTLASMTRLLTQEVPERLISLKEEREGEWLPYLSWYVVTAILDHMAPGWEWRLEEPTLHLTGLDTVGIVVVRGTLTLVHTQGRTARDGIGNETLVTRGELGGKRRYGDPYSNAESMALRRAAVKFGLGRRLYDKDYARALVARLLPLRGLTRTNTRAGLEPRRYSK